MTSDPSRSGDEPARDAGGSTASGAVATAPATAGFHRLLATFRHRLETELDAWLAAREEAERGGVAGAADLPAHLRRFVAAGGKRLRPALVFYAYRATGGGSDAAVMPLAMAMELLHSYLLIHDDVMDRSERRRSEPAAHVVHRERHRAGGWSGDSAHYGESVALLLGDLAHAYATELVAGVVEGSGRSEVRRIFHATSQEVIVGQYLEFTVPHRDDPGEEELLEILRRKSGSYSVERPIQLGAALAGADEETSAALSTLGRWIGEAFQLQDDLLGTFGRPERTGKPVSSDLAEGKWTLLVHHALCAADVEQRAAIRAVLGDHEAGDEAIATARAAIEASGARRAVQRMVEERLERARRALAGARLEDGGRRFLDGLVDYLAERDE